MRLSVLNNLKPGTSDPDIAGLAMDSRQVRPGYLFAALSGSHAEGASYIRDAIKNGAAALLVPAGTSLPVEAGGLAVIESGEPNRALSLMAARFYGGQPDHVVAVTGTNGKTSTVHFTQQLWAMRGLKSASLGTIGIHGAGIDRPGTMTTPDCITLQAQLAALAEDGITHLAMEASSHGLRQARLDGVRVAAAGFTNLTRDHLDYHLTMEEYLSAKTRLFETVLQPGGIAVLNADVDAFAALEAACAGRHITVWSYGAKGREFQLLEREPTPQGQALRLRIFGVEHRLTLPLVGAFQAMNALCALGLAMAADRDGDYLTGLENLQGAPGRLQLVAGHPQGAAVYVDYAHTPDALSNILGALRPHTEGRLFCLFGCGGDRDPGKRPMMGKIVAEEADVVIITDDNPRSEDPAKIRAAIAAGAGSDALVIDGRRAAIEWAVKELKRGDVLVLAGKGHEQGQIFADRTEPFDDVEEARRAMNRLTGKMQ